MRENRLGKEIQNGESYIGIFAKRTDICIPKLVALPGFDFFVLDTEHVAVNQQQLTNIVRVTDAAEITPIARGLKPAGCIVAVFWYNSGSIVAMNTVIVKDA